MKHNNRKAELLFFAMLVFVMFTAVDNMALRALAAVSAAGATQSTSAISITKQPEDWTGAEGTNAYFYVKAEGENLSYQWQHSSNGGSTWTDTTNANNSSRVPVISQTNTGWMYRCVISDANGTTVTSDSATLTLSDSFSIVKQPETASGALSETVYFYIQVGGTNLTYQWQTSSDGINNWTDIDSATAVTPRLAQIIRPKVIGYYYRCVITDGNGNELISDSVRLFSTDTGFITYDDSVYYVYENGGIAIGLQTIEDSIYYFSSSGIMQTGYRTIDGANYYFSTETGAAVIGWHESTDMYATYYFDADGTAHKGWLTLDDGIYYFYSNNDMARGVTLIDGEHYYFNMTTGMQETGFKEVGVHNYMYFSETTGIAQVGLMTIDGKLYYFSKEEESLGVAESGLQTDDGETYYFDSTTKQAVSGLVTVGEYTYYMGADYTMQVGLQTIDGDLYYFGTNGRMTTGLRLVDGCYYYFDTETGQAISGWYTHDTGLKFYFDELTHKPITGLQTIDGKYYYFGDTGILSTGLVLANGNYYYYPEDGNCEAGFYTVGSKTFYVDESNQLLTGLQTIDGNLYYFSDLGSLQTGIRTVDGIRYYFDYTTGEAVTGFVNAVTGYTYYFDGANGGLTGLVEIDDELYYLSDSSIVRYGRNLVDGAYYYFDYQTGAAVRGWWRYTNTSGKVYTTYYDPETCQAVYGLQEIDGELYYFDETYGYMMTGSRTMDGTKYYFDKATGAAYDGILASNANTWQTVEGETYYYDAAGEPVTGLRTVDNMLCYFDENGAMVIGWVTVDGKTYYLTETGALSDLQEISGDTYYFSPKDASLVKSCIKIIDNSIYVFNEDGKSITGWIDSFDSGICYLDESGIQLTGLQEIDGNTYWFGTNGIMTTGIQTVQDASGNTYTWYFDENGINQRGLVTYGGCLYYFDEETGSQKTGWVTVDGNEYYFRSSSGRAYSGYRTIDGVYYYFNVDTYVREQGFVKVGERLYYFTDETDNGIYQGVTEIDGKTYAFNESGYAKTGANYIDDVWYYFDPETGASLSGIYWYGSSYAYAFVAGGGYKTGLVEYNGNFYYFYPSSGRMAIGLISIDDTLYYFDAEQGMLKDTMVSVAGITYKIDEEGSVTAAGSTAIASLINSAIAKLGTPYGSSYEYNEFYVGEDADGTEYYSCSTFVKAIYADVEISAINSVSRQYYALIQAGYDIELVSDISEAQPGDIIYTSQIDCPYEDDCTFWNEIHHVMVYLGDGKVVHSTPGDGDQRTGVLVEDWTESSNYFVSAIVRVNDLYSAFDAALEKLTIGVHTIQQLVYDETYSGELSLTNDTEASGDKVLLLELVTNEETGNSEFELLASSLIDESGNFTFTVSNYSEGALVFGYNGDVNGDEAITAADTLKILRYVSNRETPDVIESGFADVDLNGVVNSTDLLKVLQYVSGRIDTFN